MNSKLNSYFSPDAPPIDLPCVVLAKDEGGEYRLPYPCVWRGDAWYALGKTKPLAIKIIGWQYRTPTNKS